MRVSFLHVCLSVDEANSVADQSTFGQMCVLCKLRGDDAFVYTNTECATLAEVVQIYLNDGLGSDGTEPVANPNRPVWLQQSRGMHVGLLLQTLLSIHDLKQMRCCHPANCSRVSCVANVGFHAYNKKVTDVQQMRTN